MKSIRAFAAAAVLAGLAVLPAHLCAKEPQVTGLAVRHRAGQTFLTWREVKVPGLKQPVEDGISAAALKKLRRRLEQAGAVRYRVYRSEKPIRSVRGLKPIAEVQPFSCWNADYYGIYPKGEHKALRYVIEDGAKPLAAGTGLYVHNPPKAGVGYYAVTVSAGGARDPIVGKGNSLSAGVKETVGRGVPVLQRIEKRNQWQYVSGGVTLNYYVRWESPPNCSEEGRGYDYLVAVPPKLAKPAPVGIHLHCWGGSLNGGYGWWYNAEKGHLLIASNQIPYDWWTGYHELYWKPKGGKDQWAKGVVRPYSQTRMLSFLAWVATKWDVDLKRTHVAGNSMGGSGSPMFAIRRGDRIAWAVGWVGVHVPAKTPQFKGSYERVYGKIDWGVKFEDGTNVWDHFSDVWYLRNNPKKETGFITFSNGKNDGGIGWPQAFEFWRALQETKRPHVFVWGQGGHGQRARMPVTLGERILEIDIRTDQTLPAFSNCSLDDNPGKGDPKDGDPKGQSNLYLYWETATIVDEPGRWEMTVSLIDKAPKDECTVDITPRRCQKLKVKPGEKVKWVCKPSKGGKQQTGQATADKHGLVTLEKVRIRKGGVRVRITR